MDKGGSEGGDSYDLIEFNAFLNVSERKTEKTIFYYFKTSFSLNLAYKG